MAFSGFTEMFARFAKVLCFNVPSPFFSLSQFFVVSLRNDNRVNLMRIFTEQAIKEYAEAHPDAKVALQEWTTIVKRSEWTCFADVKKTFNSVDNVGNQHYVFNIKGNSYRLIVVIKFTIKFVYIRFIGTHAEYDKIADCSVL